MHVHINHMFCTDPIWGKEPYWSRFMVDVEKDSRISPEFLNEGIKQDWENLTEEHEYFDKEEYENYKTFESMRDLTDEQVRKFATRKFRKLKPEVIQWLEENVKDRKDSDYKKGWCIGSDDYLYRDRYNGINLFFERRSDAMAFIKKWSVYGKPTTYFDYFRSIRKEYNPKTKTLQKVEEFS